MKWKLRGMMSCTEQQDGWLHWAERRAGLHGPDDGREDDDSVFMALSLSPSMRTMGRDVMI